MPGPRKKPLLCTHLDGGCLFQDMTLDDEIMFRLLRG